MVHVKVDDVVAENENLTGIELSLAARNAYEPVQIAMNSVCRVFDVHFEGLLGVVEQFG